MMKHRQQARFYAFDLLYLNGEDVRQLPLLTRKAKLRRLLPSRCAAHADQVDLTAGGRERAALNRNLAANQRDAGALSDCQLTALNRNRTGIRTEETKSRHRCCCKKCIS